MRPFPILLATLSSASLMAAEWSDTFLGYRTGSAYREPGLDGTLRKHILTLGHASGWSGGSNFFNVDMLQSEARDAAQGGRSGASEIYVAYRTSFALGRLTGRNLSFPGVKDVSLTAGFDWNSKNTAFAPKKRLLVLGPTFHLAVPRGFFNVGLQACQERNYNGIVRKEVAFDTTWQIALAWSFPFKVGDLPMTFSGFANQVGAKGRDGFGAETRPETLADLALLADLGKGGRLQAGLGLQYWNNKFGGANSDAPPPATNRRVLAPQAVFRIHF